MASIVNREPWWVSPPLRGQDELTCEWVYLLVYDDGSFGVDSVRPSDEEILQRRGCRISESMKEDPNFR